MTRHFVWVFMFLSLAGARGATFFVRTNGSDTNPGNLNAPWRTIQQAAKLMQPGDVVLVGPGHYGESVSTMKHGIEGAPITFRADPPNDPLQQVITRSFRVRHRYAVIDGFNITGASDLNNAAIRADFGNLMDSSNLVVTNNTIRDGVYLITTNASFGSNSITITDGDFRRAGFLPGSLVYLGADSMYAYINHDTRNTVESISQDGKTMFLKTPLKEDRGSGYWAVIYAGQSNTAFKGVSIIAADAAPTNCVIVGNTFSNLFGPNVILNGIGHTVANNRFLDMGGHYAIQPQGSGHSIRGNLFLDSRNILFFTPAEMRSIEHPIDGSYYDYQVNLIATWADNCNNTVIEGNWFQNCDNQLSQFGQGNNSYGFVIRSNVFVGMQMHGSFSMSGITFDRNTFYRNAYYLGCNHALGIGGVRGWTQTDLVMTRNVFVDNGSHEAPLNEGSYAIIDSVGYTVASNYAASAETMGWGPVRPVPPGLAFNGGDPLFVNAGDPLGPDGLPFTEDDGLRPLPNSPLARFGLGALSPIPSLPGRPIAHFRVAAPTGWFDITGNSYDPDWAALKPHQRTGPIRPWTTPEVLGVAPVTVTFDARDSLDGLSAGVLTNAGIEAYEWSFGDGKGAVSKDGTATNTFSSPGTFTITLKVRNSAGQVGTRSNTYRVRAGAGLVGPVPPARLRVLPN